MVVHAVKAVLAAEQAFVPSPATPTLPGISGHFSSHSFHIGAATVAGRNGIPDHLFQELGRLPGLHQDPVGSASFSFTEAGVMGPALIPLLTGKPPFCSFLS